MSETSYFLPRPGDFCLSLASSWWLRGIGRYAFGTERFHSALYVGNGQIVHSSIRFGGTKLDSVHNLHDPIWVSPELTLAERERVVEAGLDQVGQRFPSALPLAWGLLRKFSGDPTRPAAEQAWWVKQIVSADGGYCLRVVASAFRDAGVDLFPDLPDLLVLPSDFFSLAEELGYWEWEHVN